MKGSHVWLDGCIIKKADAVLPMECHTLHYGTGVFEGIRSYAVDGGSSIFQLEAHIDRLLRSARAMRIHIEHSAEHLIEGCQQILKANDLTDAYLRPIVYIDDVYGATIRSNGLGRVVIFAAPANEAGCVKVRAAIVSSVRRSRANSGYHHIKNTGLYSAVHYAMGECLAQNADQAVFLDDREVVCECLTENIFMVSGGSIITPPAHLPIIQGITRATIIDLLRDEGLDIMEKEFGADELRSADEIFTTSTAGEIQAIASLEHSSVADGKIGPITLLTARLYNGIKRRAVQACVR